MLKWIWLAFVVIILDQLTKYVASTSLILYQPHAVMPMFNWTLMHNPGAAFSFLHDAGGWQRWFFAVIAIAVSTVILFWLKNLKKHETWQAIALAMIMGGAIGNVIDRLRLGYVVDFIDVYYQHWHWPAFNLADSAIVVGVAIIIIDALREALKNSKLNQIKE